MVSCRFVSLDTNTHSRGFLEAGAWLIKFQQAVHYNYNLLFCMLAFIKILAEGKFGVGRKEESDNMFLLAVVLGVPAQSKCGAGMQVKTAGCLVFAAQLEGLPWHCGPGKGVGVTPEALAPPGVSQGCHAKQHPGKVGEPAGTTPFSGFCADLSCRRLSCSLPSLQLESQIFFPF